MKHDARGTTHEARILVMAMVAVSAAVVLAMPTQQELKKAQPLVAELMAPTMDDFKAKKKTAAEVADMAVKYAGEAETEAAKFMLYRSSIPYYVRGEAYDKAADAVELMKANVKDVPASVIEEIISKATVRATAKKAPRLFELYRQAKAQSVAEKDIAAFRAKLKKNPGSLPTIRNLAEALATSGDWDAALKEFAKLKDGAAQIAKKELDGSAKSVELGEFWWSYKPTYENADDAFEMRAAVHYRKALAAGEITGLKKNIVEQRIAKYGEAAVVAAAGQGSGTGSRAPAATGLYCVIDLSGGPDAKKYPVSYLNDMPKGGWSDEYKTTKLVLRRIEPGKPVLVGRGAEQRRTSVSEPYYLGVFEVTQGQWEQVMGTRPSFWRGKDYKKRPVECVSYDLIRGKNNGSEWPKSNEVDAGSFMSCVREKSGMAFDLPTDKQWEYACAAGCEADYNNGGMCTHGTKNAAMDAVGRYKFNGGWNEEKWGKFSWDALYKNVDRECDTRSGTAAVGSYEPNKWGLYDMHGNVWEWCLDWDEDHSGDRVLRSSWWLDRAWECRTSVRKHLKSNSCAYMQGFRLCLPLAGGAAAQAPAAAPIPAVKDGKAWQEKGNEATLDLGEKYGKIEFVKCPAGRVDMVVSSGGETCKVNISRPFWIMKKPVTAQQLQYNPEYKPGKDPYPCKHREMIEKFIDLVSKNCASSLPKDAVLRLPTLAEWEYAFHANTRNHKDPYYDLTKNHHDDDVAKQIYGGGNQKVANAWGMSDFGWEKVLDKFSFDELKTVNANFDRENPKCAGRLPNVTDKTDPLFWTEDGANQVFVSRMPDWVLWRCRLASGKKWWTYAWTHARLVIGPDLVSEWKAKNGKK